MFPNDWPLPSPPSSCLRHSSLFTSLLLGFGFPLSAWADATPSPDRDMLEITIEGGTEGTASVYTVDPRRIPETQPDTAALLRRAPGAGVNRNGPLTGIAQYRGMYSQRVNTLVDGMHISTGGPNGMDPPLSYIPRSQLGSLTVMRGLAPVSSGTETIGGTVVANSRPGRFSTDDTLSSTAAISLGGASVDSSGFIDATGAIASRTHRLNLFGSRERGGNYEFADGKVKPSRFERDNFGTGYGYRTGKHRFSLDLRRNETGPTGTPSLPMDIIYFNTTIARSEYHGEFNGRTLHGLVYWSDVNHAMSNYELRTSAMTRLNNATSRGAGYRVDTGSTVAFGTLLLGIDGHFSEHDSTVTDPVNTPMLRMDNFNDIRRDIYGFFAEWNGAITAGWNIELGARYNRVDMNAGRVGSTMMMANPLQSRFNNADRSKTDNNFDLVAKLVRPLSSRLSLNIEAGRKTRSPSYQERYLWLPLEATNGLADGNTYVGDIDLEPEIAYELGTGFNWRGPQFYVEPRVFYRYVDDYIQGVPANDPLVTAFNPSTLQFANVDAVLYGADAPWGITVNDNWSLNGVVSYVRGKRDDTSDNLYRIAPLNTRVTVTYRKNNWWTVAEGVVYADQNEVSATNRETKSDGYQLLNLRGGVSLNRHLNLTAGVDNLFDRNYSDHLSGINRVNAGDVAPGERIPGYGRSFYATLELTYD